jgi:signal peptidase
MTNLRQLAGQVVGVVMLGAVLAAAAALIVVPKLADARPLTVLSGSMTPTFSPGDVVVVRPVDTDAIQVGDVITFQPESDNPDLTSHRVVSVVFTAEGKAYVTRGDANGADDPTPIRPEQVRGEVWYAVPVVGRLALWAGGGWERLAIDAGAAALVLYGAGLVAGGLLDRRRERRRREVVAA